MKFSCTQRAVTRTFLYHCECIIILKTSSLLNCGPEAEIPVRWVKASIIILTKVTMGTNTVTHLLHVLVPNHLYLRDTNIRAGLCIDLGTDMPRSLFISLRPLGPYWSIVNATPYTMGQTNSFQLQLAWRPSGWFIALFSFPCIPSRINHPHAGPCDPHFIYLPRQPPCRAFLDLFPSSFHLDLLSSFALTAGNSSCP